MTVLEILVKAFHVRGKNHKNKGDGVPSSLLICSSYLPTTLIHLSLLFVLACESKKSTQYLKPDHVPVFNVPGKSGSGIPWEALVENIEIIPLETNQNSLISDIDHIIFDRDNIYIQSWHDHVLQFSKAGRHIRQIGEKGRGPGEYFSVIDFQISDGFIFILDSKSILKYDNEGRFIKQLKWNKDKAPYVYPNRFCFFNDNHYYLWSSSLDGVRDDQACYLLHHVVNGKIEESFFQTYFSGVSNHRFYLMPNKNYHIRPSRYDNTVYRLDSSSLKALYQLDFGKNSIVTDALLKGFSQEKLDENDLIMSKKNWSYVRYYFAENSKFISFSFTNSESKNGILWGLINKSNKEVYVVDKLVIDGVLPLYMIGIDHNTDQLVAMAHPYEIIEYMAKKETENVSNILSEEDWYLLENLKVDHNPILIKLTMKTL